nr:MAG TPA: Protein of unknown function (DUF1351) [Caudoviricetes sp.]
MNEMEIKTPKTVEFTVQGDFVDNLPQILSNVKEIKKWAEEQTALDRSLILQSDEDFENGKKRCAAINKVIQSIEAKRKDVKKAYNEPYDIFEKSLKEVTTVLTEAKDNLWGQITQAENEAKTRKESEYRTYFENTGLKFRTWAQIFDKKWLNKGKDDKAVKAEIDEIVSKCNEEGAALQSLNSEFITALLQYYADGHSLGDTITYNTRLGEQKRAQEEREAQARANTRPTEETPKTPQFERVEPIEEEILTIDFRVKCTATQLQALGQYMKQHDIIYGRVPKGE